MELEKFVTQIQSQLGEEKIGGDDQDGGDYYSLGVARPTPWVPPRTFSPL